MRSLTIYGASDDLIEIEGDINDEIGGPWEEPVYLAVSDGTLLKVFYDGIWRISVQSRGAAAFTKHEATDEDKDYTDKVTLTSETKFKWVLLGEQNRIVVGAEVKRKPRTGDQRSWNGVCIQPRKGICMPELAAHLERVAKELAEQLLQLERVAHAAFWRAPYQKLTCECEQVFKNGIEHDEHVRKVATEILAAALAACAREEAKWRLNHWPPLGALITVDSLKSWIRERQEEQVERIAALERAVGEKGQ